jgi:hypothetical protein
LLDPSCDPPQSRLLPSLQQEMKQGRAKGDGSIGLQPSCWPPMYAARAHDDGSYGALPERPMIFCCKYLILVWGQLTWNGILTKPSPHVNPPSFSTLDSGLSTRGRGTMRFFEGRGCVWPCGCGGRFIDGRGFLHGGICLTTPDTASALIV